MWAALLCCGCGADLAGAPVTAQRRHQVTDIEPAPAPKVTEYVAQGKLISVPGPGAFQLVMSNAGAA